MKIVYLVRHAKAVKTADIPDFKRPLDERGRQEAREVAERLAEAGKPDKIVSSTALRAMETAEIFADCFGYPRERIMKRQSIYTQLKGALGPILALLSPKFGSVLVIGHNPSMSEWAARIAPEFDGDIPTCGIVGIAVDSGTWKEAAESTGSVVFLDEPGGAPQEKRTRLMRRELGAELAAAISERLRMRHPKAADDLEDTVDRVARKLSKKFVNAVRDRNRRSRKKQFGASAPDAAPIPGESVSLGGPGGNDATEGGR